MKRQDFLKRSRTLSTCTEISFPTLCSCNVFMTYERRSTHGIPVYRNIRGARKNRYSLTAVVWNAAGVPGALMASRRNVRYCGTYFLSGWAYLDGNKSAYRVYRLVPASHTVSCNIENQASRRHTKSSLFSWNFFRVADRTGTVRNHTSVSPCFAW